MKAARKPRAAAAALRTFSDVVDAFGLTKMASLLDRPVGTVSSWKSRNSIPADCWGALVEAAHDHGVEDLTLGVLAGMAAAAPEDAPDQEPRARAGARARRTTRTLEETGEKFESVVDESAAQETGEKPHTAGGRASNLIELNALLTNCLSAEAARPKDMSDEASDAVFDRTAEVMERIADAKAENARDLWVKARAWKLAEDEREDWIAGRLSSALAADISAMADAERKAAAGAAAPKSSAPPPGKLMALGVEFDRRLTEEREAFATRGAADESMPVFTQRTDELVERIGKTPATTVPEAAVKARAMVWAAFGDENALSGEPDLGEQLMIALRDDLAAMVAGPSTVTPLQKLATEIREVTAEIRAAEAATKEDDVGDDPRWVAADKRHGEIVVKASLIDVASYADLRSLAQVMYETLPKGHRGEGLSPHISTYGEALACLVDAILSLDPSHCIGLRREHDDAAVVLAKRVVDAVEQSTKVDEFRVKGGASEAVTSSLERAAFGKHAMGRYEDALEAMLSYTPASSLLGVAAHISFAARTLDWVDDAINTYTHAKQESAISPRDRDKSKQDVQTLSRHLYFAMHAMRQLLGSDASEIGADRYFGELDDPMISPEMMGADAYLKHLMAGHG